MKTLVFDHDGCTLTVGEAILGFLEAAEYHDLKVKTIKLSMSEFRALLDDKDAREHYSDGLFCDIPLEFVTENVWGVL